VERAEGESESREQRAESREQRAKSREQRAESRGHRAGGREYKAEERTERFCFISSLVALAERILFLPMARERLRL
jgi:hypothetical protein